MKIYRGTMQIYQFQPHKDSPCGTLAALDSFQVGSPASVCIWRHRKEMFSVGWGAELQGKVRPHGKAHLVICSNQSDDHKSLFGCSSPLSSCTPTHTRLLALALMTTLSRVIQLTGLVFGWDCKTREVGCHPWLCDLFSFPLNPCFSQHG